MTNLETIKVEYIIIYRIIKLILSIEILVKFNCISYDYSFIRLRGSIEEDWREHRSWVENEINRSEIKTIKIADIKYN